MKLNCTACGIAGLIIGIAALIYATVHRIDVLIFPLLMNLSFLLFAWFFFSVLGNLAGPPGERSAKIRLQLRLLKGFFLFSFLLVNLIVRQDYLRQKLVADPLGKVLGLQGMSYEWKRDEFKGENFPQGRHNGVIAQDVEKVLPGLVGTRPDGYKGVAYQDIVPVLIEAVKEQQKIIDTQKKEIAEINQLIRKLEQGK